MVKRKDKYILTTDDRYDTIEMRRVGMYDIYFEAKYSTLIHNTHSGTYIVFHVWDAKAGDFDMYSKLKLFTTTLRHTKSLTYNELFKIARICNISSMCIQPSTFVAQLRDRNIVEVV